MISINVYISKLRTWGLKGVWNYFIGHIREYRLEQYFRRNARQYPLNPECGVTLIASFGAKLSLNKTMRDLAFALKDAGIPYQTFDLCNKSEIPDEELKGILTPRRDFRILKYSHVVEMFKSPLPDGLNLSRSTIVFWEFESGLLEFQPSLANDWQIIAMSDFNLDVFSRLLPSNVRTKKILYPFRFNPGELVASSTIRERYGLKQTDFVVFFNFDYNSSFSRKNPDGAIKAFSKAFKGNPKAKLVFKTMHVNEHVKDAVRLRTLADQLGISDQFITIDSYVPTQDLYSLTNAADVYLSLHRGEGFGLGVAEAMSLGKAVIVSDYSATTEFCNEQNSILIPCRKVEVRKEQIDHPCYLSVKEWAEPDIDAAASALLKLYGDPKLRNRLGNTAKMFIAGHFSSSSFKASVERFLNH